MYVQFELFPNDASELNMEELRVSINSKTYRVKLNNTNNKTKQREISSNDEE